jgi:hypothetical protein
MAMTLTGCVAAHVVLAAPVAAAPLTLDGQALHDDTPAVTSLVCDAGTIKLGYSVNGTASGAYPGTFTETGTLDGTALEATFTIESVFGRVTGTKTGQVGVTCSTANGTAIYAGGGTYQATIRAPGGLFTDHGTFDAIFYRCPECAPEDPVFNHFDSHFNSALDSPAPLNRNQCKTGGWRALGFRNQGECVRAAAKP